ncbi:MAG: hypothetical protein JWR54_1967 [Mucilaginibacter sp.]|nr:hypothetical protein [Mucilaginibacter sp.]
MLMKPSDNYLKAFCFSINYRQFKTLYSDII